MWLDNASEVDILFYEPYANVIADISQNPNYKPLTIGVFGVWGAGKSTLLKLIKQKIDEKAQKKEKTLCININACNGVQREHNKKLNNGLPILHKVPPKRDYGRYFCIMAEKGGTSHGGLTEKLSPFFHAKKQEVNAYGR